MVQTNKQIKVKVQQKKMMNVDFLTPPKCYYHVKTDKTTTYECQVEIGDHVKIGQVIGVRHAPFFEQNIHATISGVFQGIETHLYKNGKAADFLVVENDLQNTYKDERTDLTLEQIHALSKEEFLKLIKDNSCVGLGGSGFPTYIKMQTESVIKTVLINAVECEPFLEADKNLLINDCATIISSAEIIRRFYNAETVVIAIKNKNKQAIQVVTDFLNEHPHPQIKVIKVRDYYPQGFEKELVKSVAKVVIPPGTRPDQYGFSVLNVATIVAIYQALKYNMPLVTRQIALKGEAFKNNLLVNVKVGTLLADIITQLNPYAPNVSEAVFVVGGPMMGTNIKSADLVLSKTVSTVLALPKLTAVEQPCINCGSCVNLCPMDLEPISIMNAFITKDKATMLRLNVKNCIECGMCSYACTSKIELTNFMSRSKRMVLK